MRFTFLAVITLCLASCNLNSSEGNENGGIFGTKKPKAEIEKKVTKRDYSITPTNAYNDLFLDSMQMESFFTSNAVSDTLIRRMRSFYNARNYQYAWFASDGLTEQGRGFWNMFAYFNKTNDSVSVDGQLKKKMNRYVMLDSLRVSPSNKDILNTELLLTHHFIEYSLSTIDDGYIKRKEMERFVPQKKKTAIDLADSLVNKKHKDNKYYADVNPAYGQLMAAMGKYVTIAKNGGFVNVPGPAKLYGSNATASNIILLKQRLQQSGDLSAADTTAAITPDFHTAINKFQAAHGFKPDGKLTDAQLKAMNMPVEARLQQLLINLGRMQWMINNPEARMIRVNIPEFKLAVLENGKTSFDMNVVVGKDGHNTMTFTGNLSQVVFSPYWNIPTSIVEKEILPAIEKNPDYLIQQNMEQLPDGRFRQLPGDQNSLGRVKFLFPNSFDIYFHDTNAKDLFNRDKRAFSHGCIRLAEPEKLAEYILRDQPEWTPSRISMAMSIDEEKVVSVKNPIFVLITYYTAWVDENGLLNFRDDIYKHDKHIARKMFLDPLL